MPPPGSPFQPGAAMVTVEAIPPGSGASDDERTNERSGRLPTDGDGAATDGSGVGDRAVVGVGDADGPAPTPLGAGEPRNWVPTTRTTTTAAAPRPMGTYLFMVGQPPRADDDPLSFRSMVARTASKTGSASSVCPSIRKAWIRRSGSRCAFMPVAPGNRRSPGRQLRCWPGAPAWRGAGGTSRSRREVRFVPPPRRSKDRGSGGRPGRRAVRR